MHMHTYICMRDENSDDHTSSERLLSVQTAACIFVNHQLFNYVTNYHEYIKQ